MSLLELENVTLKFGGLTAVDDLSFSVEEGEVFAIVGPNGAGKSTVFNLISRFYDPYAGKIRFDGHDLLQVKPSGVAAFGVARTFQNIELFEHATVLQNLLVGRHRHRTTNLLSEVFFSSSAKRQEMENREKVEEVIDFLDLQAYRDKMIAGCHTASARWSRWRAHSRRIQNCFCLMSRLRASRSRKQQICGGGSTTSVVRWASPC